MIRGRIRQGVTTGSGENKLSVHAFLRYLDHHGRAILVLLTLFFLGIETSYAVNRPLSIDEFNGAWSVAQLATRTPYVDFEPYKPVLGYYVQLAFLCLGRDTWHGYLAVRLGMVYLTGTVLLLGGLRLQRIFRPGAVCLAFALMVVMTSLLEWAIEVRLDMLTALFGFVSLILLLNRRIALAGTLAGLSFLISQKGTMYALAGGIALLGNLVTHREPRWGRDVLRYGTCVVLPIGLYVLYWSLIASFPNVCGRLFAEPTQLRALTTRPGGSATAYITFWMHTLTCNPLFYLCALWALGNLLALGRRQSPLETLLLFYGGTVLAIMMSLAQPWLSSFVLLVPTLFVLQAYLFSYESGRTGSLLFRWAFWLAYGLYGLLLPLSHVPIVAQADPGVQRQTLELTEALLGPGDRYFAGFHFLCWGDTNAHSLSVVDPNGAPPTQSLTQAEVGQILERLKQEPIRLLIYTGKIHAYELDKTQANRTSADRLQAEVPYLIRRHLYRNYAPLWSNVWIYAPQVMPSDTDVDLLFTDVYFIETERPTSVLIDGQTYAPGATVQLRRGRHSIATASRVRLKLRETKVNHLLNPNYREPRWFFWPGDFIFPPPAGRGVWVDD